MLAGSYFLRSAPGTNEEKFVMAPDDAAKMGFAPQRFSTSRPVFLLSMELSKIVL